jgi:hypothetical protein
VAGTIFTHLSKLYHTPIHWRMALPARPFNSASATQGVERRGDDNGRRSDRQEHRGRLATGLWNTPVSHAMEHIFALVVIDTEEGWNVAEWE